MDTSRVGWPDGEDEDGRNNEDRGEQWLDVVSATDATLVNHIGTVSVGRPAV